MLFRSANTKIQIKRSSVTSTPAGSSLSAAEPAYSYSSNTLFIGGSDGVGVLPIGGKFYIDQQSVIFNTANAAYNQANSTSAAYSYANSVGAASNTWANTVGTAGNNYASILAANNAIGANAWANTVATAGNNYVSTSLTAVNNYISYADTAGNNYTNYVGASANSYAQQVGAAANSYTVANYVKYSNVGSQLITSDVAISGNLTISGMTTFANTQQLQVGDNIITLNADLPLSVAPVDNAGVEVNRGNLNSNASLLWIESSGKWAFTGNNLQAITTFIASNTLVETYATAGNNYVATSLTATNNYTNSVGTAGNNYTNSVGAAGNSYMLTVATAQNNWITTSLASGNAWSNAVGSAGNSYAQAIGSAANTNAANGSYISTGTVDVLFGGTGINSATLNGIVFGNGTGPFNVTAAGTDGQVLQSVHGVPQFEMLDGGVF